MWVGAGSKLAKPSRSGEPAYGYARMPAPEQNSDS
jgi:hypothetical protein